MYPSRQLICRQEAVESREIPGELSRCPRLQAILLSLAEAMADLAYPESDISEVREALAVALGKTVRPGPHSLPAHRLEVDFQVTPERVVVDVEGQEEGAAVPGNRLTFYKNRTHLTGV